MYVLFAAGPVGIRLTLGQSSARWQLRLPQPAADALFPEQEAAIASVEAVEADVLASDQEGGLLRRCQNQALYVWRRSNILRGSK